MKCDFISHNGNSRLILIFTGWSTNKDFYAGLHCPGWDIMVVSGYSDFNFPVEILDSYSTITVFAWSLGVLAASQSLPPKNIAMAIAVNGTLYPVDDEYGIARNIFIATERNLDPRNLLKFRKRMTGKFFNDVANRFTSDDIETLQKELRFIEEQSRNKEYGNGFRWQKAYISRDDRIFPPESQKRFWQNLSETTEVVEVEAPHYIDLSLVIRAALPETEKISNGFKKALATYEDSAFPQKEMAEKLAGMAGEEKRYRHILEIGPATGMFTRLIAIKLRPDVMEFIDLFPLNPFRVAAKEFYHIGDGEKIIQRMAEERPACFDAVVSSATLQWFVNPELFFRNAAEILNEKGLLLCSTFQTYNLEELIQVNPFGLVYRSAKELKDLISLYFSDVEVIEDQIECQFDNNKMLLLHIQNTGIGRIHKSSKTLSELLNSLPGKLTYRPVYIRAERPKRQRPF